MAKIGSWWLASHDAAAGESVTEQWLANRATSSIRAQGGKLFLTNRRVLFSPHLLDYALAGRRWGAELSDVVDISRVDKKGSHVTAGGARDRLRIELSDGSASLFVVNGLDRVIERLQAAVDAAEPHQRST